MSEPDDDQAKKERRKAMKRRASQLKVAQKIRKQTGDSPGDSSATSSPPTAPKIALLRLRNMQAKVGKRSSGFRGKFLGMSSDRTFSIENGRFILYKGKSQTPRVDCDLSEISAYADDLKNDLKKGRFAFQVSTPKRRFILYANSEDERSEWLRQLRALKEGEGIASAKYSQLEGLNKPVAAGRTSLFTLTGYDIYEQRCVEGGTVVEATVESPDSSSHPCTVKDNKDGSYLIAYKPVVVGDCELHVTVGGETLPGETKFVVGAGAASPEDSYARLRSAPEGQAFGAVPASASVGVTTHLEIVVCDAYGNSVSPKKTPSIVFRRPAQVSDSEGEDHEEEFIADDVLSHCTEVKVGLYHLEFTPKLTGLLRAYINLSGKPIRDSPYEILVRSGPPVVDKTMLTGDNLGTGILYTSCIVNVLLYDSEDNPCDSNLDLSCHFTTMEETLVTSFEWAITAYSDGEFELSYTAHEEGQFLMHLMAGSAQALVPFPIFVSRAPPSPSKCRAVGMGVAGARVAGESTTFSLQLLDSHSNPAAPGASVSVKFANANGSPLSSTNTQYELHIHENSTTGESQVTYSIGANGSYRMSVAVEGEEIHGSPFNINIGSALPSPTHSKFTMGSNSPYKVDTEYSMSVVVKDTQGLNFVGKPALGLMLRSDYPGDGDLVNYTVVEKDIAHGVFTINYTILTSGFLLVIPTINGLPIEGSPFEIEVEAGEPSAKRSTFALSTLGPAEMYSNCSAVLVLLDAKGNRVINSEIEIEVLDSDGDETTELEIELKQDPKESHRYVLSFCPENEGDFDIVVKINDEEFKRLHLVVPPAPLDIGRTQVWGPGLESALAGTETSIEIGVSDKRGFVSTIGASVTYQFLDSDDHEVDFASELIDAEDGTFVVKFTPSKCGAFAMDLRINGIKVHGSPYLITVENGGVDSTKSSLRGPNSIELGTSFSFAVHLKDGRGLPPTEDPPLEIRSEDESILTVDSVEKADDGLFQLVVTGHAVGTASLRALLSGKDIRGSPLTVNIGSGDQTESNDEDDSTTIESIR